MSDKCIIHGCPNHKNQGSFIGDMCAPCSNMLISGEPKFGVTFIHKMRDRIEELEKACKEWADVSQSNYQRAKAAEAKLAEMQVVGDAMAASIEGNYYVAGIAKMWRTIAKIKSQGDEFAMQKGEQP